MMWVWLNGQLCRAEAAHVPLTDRGLTLGDGLFETIRVYKGQPLRMASHARRLQAGGQILGLRVPDQASMNSMAAELVAANNVHNGSLRLTVTRGSGPRGLLPPAQVQPTVFMTASPGIPTYKAVTLITSRLVRQDEQSVLCGIKTLNYLPFIVARQEAARCGAEEALILNTQGRVAETTISTVIVQQGGALLTPASKEGALLGVARGILLQAGIVHEACIDPTQLMQAEAVYLVNSLGLRVVSACDGTSLAQNLAKLPQLAAALALEEFL